MLNEIIFLFLDIEFFLLTSLIISRATFKRSNNLLSKTTSSAENTDSTFSLQSGHGKFFTLVISNFPSVVHIILSFIVYKWTY